MGPVPPGIYTFLSADRSSRSVKEAFQPCWPMPATVKSPQMCRRESSTRPRLSPAVPGQESRRLLWPGGTGVSARRHASAPMALRVRPVTGRACQAAIAGIRLRPSRPPRRQQVPIWMVGAWGRSADRSHPQDLTRHQGDQFQGNRPPDSSSGNQYGFHLDQCQQVARRSAHRPHHRDFVLALLDGGQQHGREAQQ